MSKELAEDLAYRLRTDYVLTYRCSVNLEAIANRLLEKFSRNETEDIMRDFLDNVEFMEEEEEDGDM